MKRWLVHDKSTYRALVEGVVGIPHGRIDVVQIPLEGAAVEVASQLLAGGYILLSDHLLADGLARVVDLLVLVHPDLGTADRILLDDVDARLPLVGRAVAEDVAHATTGHRHKGTATHPYAKRDLEVLAAPDLHARVVRADVAEVLLGYGEQTAGLQTKQKKWKVMEIRRKIN